MADLNPHPLVTALAKELIDEPALKKRINQVPTHHNLVAELAGDSDVPGLVTFAGYLGGSLTDPKDKQKTWMVLYLDAKLLTWLAVQKEGIVLRERMKDETSPRGKRDVIWVKNDAFVTKGSTPPAPERRFLQGDLVRAGDFSASLTAPSLSPATGVFCEADTVGCCKKGTW